MQVGPADPQAAARREPGDRASIHGSPGPFRSHRAPPGFFGGASGRNAPGSVGQGEDPGRGDREDRGHFRREGNRPLDSYAKRHGWGGPDPQGRAGGDLRIDLYQPGRFRHSLRSPKRRCRIRARAGGS